MEERPVNDIPYLLQLEHENELHRIVLENDQAIADREQRREQGSQQESYRKIVMVKSIRTESRQQLTFGSVLTELMWKTRGKNWMRCWGSSCGERRDERSWEVLISAYPISSSHRLAPQLSRFPTPLFAPTPPLRPHRRRQTSPLTSLPYSPLSYRRRDGTTTVSSILTRE